VGPRAGLDTEVVDTFVLSCFELVYSRILILYTDVWPNECVGRWKATLTHTSRLLLTSTVHKKHISAVQCKKQCARVTVERTAQNNAC
jgi:hypothetical protein